MIRRAVLRVGSASCLDLLVDRSFVRHVIDQLARAGVREVDLLTLRGAGGLEMELGDGGRWGIALRYHDTHDDAVAHVLLSRFPPHTDREDVLLGQADVLVPPAAWSGPRDPGDALRLYQFGTELRPASWTGWCRAPAWLVRDAARRAAPGGLLTSLLATARTVTHRPCAALSARDSAELLEANLRVVAGEAPFLVLHGRLASDRIWKGRGARVHPTAELRAPVYLGSQVEIGPDAVVGPGVVVGAGSILDYGVVARNCVIAPHTFVAAGTTLQRCTASSRAPDAVSPPVVDLREITIAGSINSALEACAAWFAGLSPKGTRHAQ